jgi:hypothetical protein
MPDNEWDELRNAEPHGGRCARGYTGDYYDWYHVPGVDISGSRFPAGGVHRFNAVGMKKRSHCGSFSRAKPALAINLGKYSVNNMIAADQLIGTPYVTLNNSRQDHSFIRQPLGYELFRRAGLPYSRCNFCTLTVNGDYIGFYINVEPVKESHIEHNFRGNLAGNLYEIETLEDFTRDVVESDRIGFEGFSPFEDRRDLRIVVDVLDAEGVSGLESVVDVSQFLRHFAMEVILKHWDGYSSRPNNAFLYNDVRAVANPTRREVNFKLIPWGIDQILEHEPFKYWDSARIADLVSDDEQLSRRLEVQVANLARYVFGWRSFDYRIRPFISVMARILSEHQEDHALEHVPHVIDVLRSIPEAGLGVLPRSDMAITHVLDNL